MDKNPLPAFPQPLIANNERGIDFPFNGYGMGGLSKREYIALHIACAAVANCNTTCPWGNDFIQKQALEFADVFIKLSDS